MNQSIPPNSVRISDVTQVLSNEFNISEEEAEQVVDELNEKGDKFLQGSEAFPGLGLLGGKEEAITYFRENQFRKSWKCLKTY